MALIQFMVRTYIEPILCVPDTFCIFHQTTVVRRQAARTRKNYLAALLTEYLPRNFASALPVCSPCVTPPTQKQKSQVTGLLDEERLSLVG